MHPPTNVSRLADLRLALALVGTAVTAYLVFVALDARAEPFCTGVGDCQAVQSSEYAEVAGVPVAVLGLGMYVGLLALAALRRFGPRKSDARVIAWTFALALSGTLYSVYLTYLEFFVIEAICMWCLLSALIVTAICLLTLPDLQAARRGRRTE